MAEVIITSFIANGGVPVTTATPTIRIWRVSNYSDEIIIGGNGSHDPLNPGGNSGGSTSGSTSAIGDDGQMVPLSDPVPGAGGNGTGGDQDGFYKFTFSELNGYNPTESYVVRVDAGKTMPESQRYQVQHIASRNNDTLTDSIVKSVYGATAIDYARKGSFGELFNTMKADTAQLNISMAGVTDLINLLLKFETNRTKVDGVNKTLTIYDDDCETPLRTFSLVDSNGQPSTEEICERIPLASGTTDGLSTCQ